MSAGRRRPARQPADEPDAGVARVEELCAELFDLAATSLSDSPQPDTLKPMYRAASHAAALAEALGDELLAIDPRTMLPVKEPRVSREARGADTEGK